MACTAEAPRILGAQTAYRVKNTQGEGDIVKEKYCEGVNADIGTVVKGYTGLETRIDDIYPAKGKFGLRGDPPLILKCSHCDPNAPVPSVIENMDGSTVSYVHTNFSESPCKEYLLDTANSMKQTREQLGWKSVA